MRVSTQKTPIIVLTFFGLSLLFFAGCSKSPSEFRNASNTPQSPTGPFTPPAPPAVPPSVPTTGGLNIPANTTGGGSGPQGQVTQFDTSALQNALSKKNEVAPVVVQQGQGSSLLSAELRAEAERVLQQERDGQQVTIQKLQLAGRMLAACAERLAQYAPIPGQPLLGTWNGGGACAVQFEVSGAGQNSTYSVTGGTQGTLVADRLGNGVIQGDPMSGNVTDSPESGRGSLVHPTFHRSKSGTSSCRVLVTLDDPKSPIPQNYQEGMKLAGYCLNQTLVLLSPSMDHIDPALREILLSRFVGLQ